MRSLILEYTVVGGMPDAVQSFVDARDVSKVLSIQRDIVRGYEDDMVKYAPSADKPLIKQCFKSIPRQLAKEDKKWAVACVAAIGLPHFASSIRMLCPTARRTSSFSRKVCSGRIASR